MRGGSLFDGFSKLGELFLLSIIYVVSCVPIVTFGAATSALYYVTLKMAEGKRYYIWEDYVKSFKANFKQATIIWVIYACACAVVAADLLLAGSFEMQLGSVIAVIAIVLTIFLVLLGLYVFPLLARFDNTVLKTMKNAVLIAIRHLPSTIAVALLHAVPLLVAFFSVQAFIKGFPAIMVFVAAPLAYLESKLFVKVFYNYYPKVREIEKEIEATS